MRLEYSELEFNDCLLLEIDILPLPTLAKLYTAPQLSSCALVKLLSCLRHLLRLHQVIQKLTFVGRFGRWLRNAHHQRAE